MKSKSKILVFSDWFEPGFKAGGPIRSVVNFVTQMEDDYEIRVFTSDRDLSDSVAYPGITQDAWLPYGRRSFVYYCSPGNLRLKHIREVIRDILPDYIYLNSMYSLCFTIYPLLSAGRANPSARLILSPRGMLKRSAVAYKKFKKIPFLRLFKLLGFHKRLVFHATDQRELNDVRRYFGKRADVQVLQNFPRVVDLSDERIKEKEQGRLGVLFVGRIHPIKNLDFLLQLLPSLTGTLKLIVIGNEEDKTYSEKCRHLISGLPPQISVSMAGEIPHHHISDLIHEQHIFALPTRGENFGHAIVEALAAGKPVLISDQTPWRNLTESKAGWDLPLSDTDGFRNALQTAMDWDQEQYREWSAGARKYAEKINDNKVLKEGYSELFN